MCLVVEMQLKLNWSNDQMNFLDVNTPWINLTAEATELCMQVYRSAYVVTGLISCKWYIELESHRKVILLHWKWTQLPEP